jgi:hypothetical protein
VSSQWILALLFHDSLADSLTGFTRWIRSLLTLELLVGVTGPSHRSAITGFAR